MSREVQKKPNLANSECSFLFTLELELKLILLRMRRKDRPEIYFEGGTSSAYDSGDQVERDKGREKG